MSRDPFRKVVPGDKLRMSAIMHNRLADIARAHGPERNFPKVPIELFGAKCLVLNDSGSDVPEFGILKIKEPLASPGSTKPDDEETPESKAFQTEGVIVSGDAPESEEKFVITLEPIADGKIGWAVCGGLVQCRLEVEGGVEEPTAADMIDDDNTKLKAGASGWASIVWKQEGTGTVWALVSIGGASSCPPRNEIQIITVFGRPAGGSFALLVQLPDSEGEMVGESITIQRGDDSAAILDALETHSVVVAIREAEEEAEEDPQELFALMGGPLPNNAVRVEFKGEFAGKNIPIMLPQNFDDLTGGTGVGVLVSVDTQGHPN